MSSSLRRPTTCWNRSSIAPVPTATMWSPFLSTVPPAASWTSASPARRIRDTVTPASRPTGNGLDLQAFQVRVLDGEGATFQGFSAAPQADAAHLQAPDRHSRHTHTHLGEDPDSMRNRLCLAASGAAAGKANQRAALIRKPALRL